MIDTKLLLKVVVICGIGLLAAALHSCIDSEEPTDEPIQTLPMHQIKLDNLEYFQDPEDNWQIAGGVESSRTEEHDLQGLEGTGTLVNIPTDEAQDHILTEWKHGDLELELDFLMPKGSNSGIYLMGRYEMQLFDSWGVEDPQFSDRGGIYQHWDQIEKLQRLYQITPNDEIMGQLMDNNIDSAYALMQMQYGEQEFVDTLKEELGRETKARLAINAARAPGLWQHVKILFRAPAFNEQGEKISNAKFEEVWLNGTLVQEDVEVTGPTRTAPFTDEQTEGPLMIQGDHGPVAIRNIRYKKYDKNHITLTDLKYDYYADSLDQIPDFETLEVAESGTTDSLSGSVIDQDDQYALQYSGTLETPNSGTYLFKLQTAGMVRMLIDDEVVFDQDRFYRMHEMASKTVELQEGQHDFTLEYVDHHNNWYWGLGLFAEGPQLRHQKLHASSSVPSGDRELPDLITEAEDRIKILRSFAMHDGAKRTHVVNVGAPNKINYSYDMGQATLLQAWNGPFINASEMWINRGEPQTASPVGPAFSFDGQPVAARLSTDTAVWPDSLSWDQLRVEGYTVSDDGSPVFQYLLDGVRIEDHFEGFAEERRLVRTVLFEAEEPQNDFWIHLASGEEIIEAESGEYIVDDRTFYLDIIDTGGPEPQIVETDEGYDLRIQLLTESQTATIQYAIIW